MTSEDSQVTHVLLVSSQAERGSVQNVSEDCSLRPLADRPLTHSRPDAGTTAPG